MVFGSAVCPQYLRDLAYLGYDHHYGHSQQYYLHQKNYVAFLQALLSDTKRFPGFPRHSDGRVIVDTHPDYGPLCTNEVIGDNKC